jgi:F0F1-type ATP synthase membrane subunit b/b'
MPHSLSATAQTPAREAKGSREERGVCAGEAVALANCVAKTSTEEALAECEQVAQRLRECARAERVSRFKAD